MQATPEQIHALIALQDIDRTRLRAQLELKKLPQPAQIDKLHEQKDGITEKRDQIATLLKRAEAQQMRLHEEDDTLVRKQAATQERIEELKDDYRSVTSLTRDLEGMAKRRESLAFELEKVEKRLAEITHAINEAERALSAIADKEAQLLKAYHAQADDLVQTAQVAEAKRGDMAARVPAALLRTYEKTLARCGGVALATLEDDHCAVCRNAIEANRLLQIKAEAPISECPNCHRMLIVE